MKFSHFLLSEVKNLKESNTTIKTTFDIKTRSWYENALSVLNINNVTNYIASDNITYNGTTFKKNYYILYQDIVHEIIDILLHNNLDGTKTIFLVLQEQICFKDAHFNCYDIIKPIPELKFISINYVQFKPSQSHTLNDGKKVFKVTFL